MQWIMHRAMLGVVLAGLLPFAAVLAEEESPKTLPTLLIKGEIVSLDTTDPAAQLLKVKDRYGFETPIFLMAETKITQGDAMLEPGNLATGTAVEVEYNFDVNTAKRHAVSVKVPTPAPATETAAAPAAAAPAASAPEVPAVPAAMAVEAIEPPAAPAEAAPEANAVPESP